MRQIRRILFVAVLAVAAGACGKSPADGDSSGRTAGSAIDNAAKVAFQMQPGKYRTTVSVDRIEIPGMPARVGEQMKAMMAEAASAESCVTAQDAARGVEVLKQQMARGKCRFEKFEASGNRVDGAFTCQTGDGMTMTANSSGDYSPTGSRVRLIGDMSGPGGKTMHVEQTVITERIGDCT